MGQGRCHPSFARLRCAAGPPSVVYPSRSVPSARRVELARNPVYLPTSWRANRAPLLLVALLVVLIVWSMRSSSQRTYAPLSAYFGYAEASVPVNAVTPLPAARAEVIQRSDVDWATQQIDLVLETDTYRDELPSLSADLQAALDYVQQRTEIQLSQRVRVVLTQDESCGFHGITYSDVRVITIYSCPGVASQRVVNIAAHEFVHQLEHDRYGPPHLSADLLLSEGFATWGAGRYWLGGEPTFAAFAARYQHNGSALPLSTHYAGLGIDAMNVLYYEWAAFVDYLLAQYGRAAFDALYVSGGGQQPGAASYSAVYNLSLSALEANWRAQLPSP